MYTKEEMLMFTTCVSCVECKDCPFERIGGELVYKPDCYKENVSQYKKEKEMQEQKDPLTYKSLALVINHEIKICHKNMEPHEWIAIHDDGKWRDNNNIVYSPVFSRIEDWTYWTEPKEEFKPYSIDIWLDTDTPKPNSSYFNLGNRLTGSADYNFHSNEEECKHKFKITVEKAD